MEGSEENGTSSDIDPVTDMSDETTGDRRGMLRLAIAAAGAAALAMKGATEADAATGTPAVVGQSNWGYTETVFIHNNLTSTSSGPGLVGYRTSGTTTGYTTFENCGVLGSTEIAGQAGVMGFGASDGNGVEGYSYSGSGAWGRSSVGPGVLGFIDFGGTGVGGSFAGGRAQLLLVPGSSAGAPTTLAHSQGELFLDKNATLFLCTASGTPGTWLDISSPAAPPPPPPASAPTLHFVTPTRVFDSREALPDKGPIASGQNRTVAVADGRAISGGGVTAAGLVPVGSTGVAYNLTIVNTVGQGYLSVNPGGNTTVTSSAINWYANGQIVACGSVVGVNAARQVSVIAGGGGSTDFVIDEVGYYR